MDEAVRLPAATADWIGGSDPARLAQLRRRRVFAWAIDVAVCGLLTGAAAIPATFLGLMSFGVLWGPAWLAVGLVPLAYNAILISGAKRATWGQRLAGVRIETPDGRPAHLLQAAIHFVLFYLGVGFTFGLIVLWSFFDAKKALVHDRLAGLEGHRAPAEPAP
jgi:uncharacterized RDD family membrane protein YckC